MVSLFKDIVVDHFGRSLSRLYVLCGQKLFLLLPFVLKELETISVRFVRSIYLMDLLLFIVVIASRS